MLAISEKCGECKLCDACGKYDKCFKCSLCSECNKREHSKVFERCQNCEVFKTCSKCKTAFSSWENYLDKLKCIGNDTKGNVLYTASGFDFLKQFEIQDFKRFTQFLIDKVSKPHNFCKSIIASITNKDENEMNNYDPFMLIFYFENLSNESVSIVDAFFEKLVGCRERCPFCQTSCQYENKDHAGEHIAAHHHPMGVVGIKWKKSNELMSHSCQSLPGKDLSAFLTKEASSSTISWTQCEANPNKWKIAPDSSMQNALYWKWFMNKFNDDLANHFNAKPCILPQEWAEIKWTDAKQNLLAGQCLYTYYASILFFYLLFNKEFNIIVWITMVFTKTFSNICNLA